MVCKVCGEEFELVEGLNYCPKCGSLLEVVEKEYGCAWENRSKYGVIEALYRTWKESLFTPTQFFKSVAPKDGFGSALIYALIFGIIGMCFAYFWQFISEIIGLTFYSQNPQIEQFLSGGMLILMLLLSPIIIIIGLLITTAIYHLFLLIVRGANNGFEATFKAISYSSGVYIFQIIPFCGGFIAGIWLLFLYVIGLREIHRTSTGKALFAVFVPVILCVVFLVVVFLVFFSAIIGRGFKFN